MEHSAWEILYRHNIKNHIFQIWLNPGSAFFLGGRIRIHVFKIPNPQLCFMAGNLKIILIAATYITELLTDMNSTYYMTQIHTCIHGINS